MLEGILIWQENSAANDPDKADTSDKRRKTNPAHDTVGLCHRVPHQTLHECRDGRVERSFNRQHQANGNDQILQSARPLPYCFEWRRLGDLLTCLQGYCIGVPLVNHRRIRFRRTQPVAPWAGY